MKMSIIKFPLLYIALSFCVLLFTEGECNPTVALSFKVTFDTDGGSAVAAQDIEQGTKATKPTADPTKEGYTFEGWFKADKTTVFNFATETITAATTIYAKWEQTAATSFTVSFNTDGGSTIAAVSVASGAKASKPADPTKDGYTFLGWYKADKSTEFDFTAETITAATTIYAKWEVVVNIDVTLTHTGQHEIIAQATSNTDVSVGFVVSYSATAPDFNTIKDKGIFYKRDLVNATPLLVYMGVTDLTPDDDASAFGTDGTTGFINNPAQFMIEDTDYHLYIYDVATGSVLKSHNFHTLAMPTGAEVAAMAAGEVFGVSTMPGQSTSIGIREGETLILPARIGKPQALVVLQRSRNTVVTCDLLGACFPTNYAQALQRFRGEVATGSGFNTQSMLFYIGKSKTGKANFWKFSDGSTTPTGLFILVAITD